MSVANGDNIEYYKHSKGMPRISDYSVMLFDGKCVFCNGAVNFALSHESQPILRFAALQSDAGLALSRQYGLPTDDFRTFVIVRDGKAYTRFEAAVRLATSLAVIVRVLPG